MLEATSLQRSECPCCLCTAIYTVHCTCCVSTGSKPAEEGKKVDKPMYLRDYERKQLLERGAMAGVSDSEEEGEQKKVRKSVLCACVLQAKHSTLQEVLYLQT